MKTFEEELRALGEWREARYTESNKLSINDVNFRDSKRGRQEIADSEEYRRRLAALKEKYNVKT
jgi:hypothetical protein